MMTVNGYKEKINATIINSSNLFNDFMGWLTIGILVFMIVMLAFLFSMFVKKSAGK